MNKSTRDFLTLALLLGVLIIFFSRILFTEQIIRAPDILNESYWWMKGYAGQKFSTLYSFNLTAGWNSLVNSGHTNEGGMNSISFLLHMPLILHFIPPPASVAWFIVLHFFFGAAGMYCYCRLIGTGRPAACFAALVFALSPEIVSLINAGHVMKIATISYAPWAFFCLEKGFLSRRLLWFMTTAFVLAFQFFNTHWQVAYYTCLCVGAYGIIRTIIIIVHDHERDVGSVSRILGLNLVVLFFFLSTVSISLLPLANWSKATNRGVQSGANQGKGGLDREEAMSWSMPPEEIAAFAIPGLFGFSRQESGPNPDNIRSYYWGRMFITQTLTYMGLLPWLLIPLPFIFRRDKYTLLAALAIAGGVLFSMGKFSPFYTFLFDHFPGINRFRVPKMMMFIPVIGIGILAARGIDLLLDEDVKKTAAFRKYVYCLMAIPILLILLLAFEVGGKNYWIAMFLENLLQPTRYEQGVYLVTQRWDNLVHETGIASIFASLCALTIFIFSKRWVSAKVVVCLLLAIYVSDVGRVNAKFMFLVPEPEKSRGKKTPVTDFLSKGSTQYRTLPMDGSDPNLYTSNGIPVMYTSNPVQLSNWQQFLESFNVASAMPDIMNVKYLIMPATEFQQQKAVLSDRFVPVFTPPDSESIVLENRRVLPKSWLVPSVIVSPEPAQRLSILQNPMFNPLNLAIVETPPTVSMADLSSAVSLPQSVTVSSYENERIAIDAQTPVNALLVTGEKFYKGWKATVDGKKTEIVPVNHVLRGVYLTPGAHKIAFIFDPLPYKIGKYLTLCSFALFAGMLLREWALRRKRVKGGALSEVEG
ncbi:MAG: YfhO family protein [Desulfuromonadales bacterium]